MEQVVMELFSNQTNVAIVRTPGRKFPGVVVQGDSLSIMCDEARRVVQALEALERSGQPGLGEALPSARRLLTSLQARQDAYERCLAAHGIKLPYAKRTSP